MQIWIRNLVGHDGFCWHNSSMQKIVVIELMLEIMIFSFFWLMPCFNLLTTNIHWLGWRIHFDFQVEGKLSRKLQAASKLAQIQQIIRQENDFAIPKCGNLSSKSQKIIIWRWFLDTNIHTYLIWINSEIAKWILPTYVTRLFWSQLQNSRNVKHFSSVQF